VTGSSSPVLTTTGPISTSVSRLGGRGGIWHFDSPLHPHGLYVAGIEALLSAPLRLLERPTCAGGSLWFGSAVLEPLVNRGFVYGVTVLRIGGRGEKTDGYPVSTSQSPGRLHPVVED
jgi:hypothetical protein